MDRLKFNLEIVEALSASPPTNKSVLTDDEDNSVVIPLAKRLKRYNPPVVPDSTLDPQPVPTVDERIPIVHSLTPGKIYETAARNKSLVSNSTHRCRSNDYCPCRRIILCEEDLPGLDLPATYNPHLIRTTVFRKPHKPIPVVQSASVFELCKALNLTVKLAPQ
ncbi:hypothetical protein TNCV_4701271 [Trichonephila clavipes]|nr:hypothetical protein TNCV_4701271 [Trichonephila clavipes]